MKETFYIIEVSPQWYNLLVKDSHFCLACGTDLEVLKKTIYNCVRKYKTEDRLNRVIEELSNSGQIAPSTFNQRQKDFDSGKHLVFEDLVEEVVAEALKDNRKDTPYHRVKERLSTSVTSVKARSISTDPVTTRVVKRVTPLAVRRVLL